MHGRDTMYEAASLYYLQNQTMDAIGARLGMSRSTVSRVLREARETGLVRISLAPATRVPSRLAEQLQHTFGATAHVVPIRESAAPAAHLEAVARQAASLVNTLMGDDTTLGVAWGTTVSAVAAHLTPQPTNGSAIVQLNGAAGTSSSGIAYAGEILARFGAAFDAEVHYFPVPAFFDDASTREALWRERAVRRVLDLHDHLDVGLFGVGSFSGPQLSHVYAGGYLTAQEMAELLRLGAVGDICTVALRADGSYADIPLNARASGPSPAVLARVPRRVCVVAGRHRAAATVGALRSGAVTDLVIDEPTARFVLASAGVGGAERSRR